jgi:hypothetical protein
VPERFRHLVDPDAPKPGKVQSNHPDTSRAAAAAQYPRGGTLRRKVLDAVAVCGDFGLTDEELMVACEMKPNTMRPRRVELVEGGWLKDSGKTRQTAQGFDSIVWVLTEEARGRA